jgi:predicted phosphodiesterase
MIEFDGSGPLLVFGGPYSNLRATLALREEARRRGIPPERTICTGDIVAYCAEPEETVRLIADWGIRAIQGNCEQQLAAGAADCACNFEEGSACDLLAKGWYPFAAGRVSEASRRWMAALPATMRLRMGGLSFRVVHGGVDEVSRWVFASDGERLEEECAASGERVDVVIAGHCGLPFIGRAATRTWLNAGVIGMPANDGTTDVWFAIVTPRPEGGVRLSTHRLAYPHAEAAAAMRRLGYANGYARTLVTGLWPSLDILPAAERMATGRAIEPTSLDIPAPTLAPA